MLCHPFVIRIERRITSRGYVNYLITHAIDEVPVTPSSRHYSFDFGELLVPYVFHQNRMAASEVNVFSRRNHHERSYEKSGRDLHGNGQSRPNDDESAKRCDTQNHQ
jgi:hypothetical protein